MAKRQVKKVARVDLDNELFANVPFVFEMIRSFLLSACYAVDSVLEDLDGFVDLGTDDSGRPKPPNDFSREFAQLSNDLRFKYIGASLHATSILGLAYAHSFCLLSLLTTKTKQKKEKPSVQINSVAEYDKLSAAVKRELNGIYSEVQSHDFELEISLSPIDSDSRSVDRSGEDQFRQNLVYWEKTRTLQYSHMLFSYPTSSAVRLMIPLRSILVLDGIIAAQLAPRLGIEYKKLDWQLSRRTEDPRIDWDGETISVSLPDKLGRILDARWTPTITSVVRIKEAGEEEWSPGFETIFNRCSFVGLKPDTEYEMQLTHKTETGEGEPSISRVRTKPEN